MFLRRMLSLSLSQRSSSGRVGANSLGNLWMPSNSTPTSVCLFANW